MYLTKEKLQHINTISHEGKVVIVATDADGKIWYSVKQDGFEDSYLNTPPEQRTGWENWQELELPNEADDQSVIDQETAELTDAANTSNFVLRSRYKTFDQTAVAPTQLVSALGHVYIFRQSKTNTLLCDRFVLDGMTNKLNRKLEVRFKRSRQKHEASKNMKKGASGLTNIDTLDFRDANGNFFYEPTTELSIVNNLQKGWFSVVLVPTIENDVHRWHIFAYNSQTQKVELTTMRVSDEGLFDVQDYTIFEESNDSLIPRSIAGIIKRTLDLGNVSVVNGLTATKYDVQREKQTEDGMQLLRESTKVMLAIPTSNGNVAAFSFAIAGDGILSQISKNPTSKIWRNTIRQILLPLNTLDNVKAIGTTNPPPQGRITALQQGEDDGVNVVSSTDTNLETTNQVKISGTQNYNIFQQSITKIDDDSFEIASPTNVLGNWEVIPEEESGLVFNGMITAYEITDTGNIKITAKNHGLNDGESLQILDTRDYNGTYTVKKIDDKTFTLDDIKWQAGTAVNLKLESQKRRGLQLDGVNDYVEIPYRPELNPQQFTVSCWTKVLGGQGTYRSVITSRDENPLKGYIIYAGDNNKWQFWVGSGGNWNSVTGSDIVLNTWTHLAAAFDGSKLKLYINGVLAQEVAGTYVVNTARPLRIGAGTTEKSPQLFFNGQIAELCIWKIARTEEQIRNSMYLQLTGKELGLVGYWRLGAVAEEGKERKVIDFSVNGNDGVVYGGAYVSAATLSRNLSGTDIPAIKYENEELFAVSENATYEEEFEFKVTPAVDPNNVDGQGGKIFQMIYKGKNNRSAIDWLNISANATEFTDIGGGWYKAKCRFNVPEGVSLVRSFGIGNVKGSWTNLEIRKQLICLVSDSITEAKYTDTVNLATLADNHAQLAVALKQIEVKEQQEALLIKEKRQLDGKIAAYNAQAETRTKIDKLTAQITTLTSEEQTLSAKYNAELNSPFNYECQIVNLSYPNHRLAPCGFSGNRYYMVLRPIGDEDYYHNWKFVSLGGGTYHIVNLSYPNHRLAPCGFSGSRYNMVLRPIGDEDYYHNWAFVSLGGGTYHIVNLSYPNHRLAPCGFSGNRYNMVLRPIGDEDYYHNWAFVSLGTQTNNNIPLAYQDWQKKLQQLNQAKEELKLLNAALVATAADKAAWEARIAQIIQELSTIQTELSTLNTNFINGVKTTQQTPQAMPQIGKDNNGLITQGAFLGFVSPASRLHAIETCEGNVQLSYFDSQGRMRLTNYDATSDSSNTAFEQWLPDAQRACLNLSNANSVVKLNQQVYLSTDWSIEAWFYYPLPETAQWNTLIRGQNADSHIVVSRDQKLGIYLTNDSLKQCFYDCGFSMESLSIGWHHLTAVGEGDTTRFYIDGKPVGDTKEKALADAQAILNQNPTDTVAQQKVADIKLASLKVTGDVYAIGNNHLIASQSPDYGVMKFDGVNDYIQFPYLAAHNPSQFTVSCWVKVAGGTSHRSPICSRTESAGTGQKGYIIYIAPDNKVQFWVGNGSSWSPISGPVVTLNTWIHVTGTYDGSTLRLYVNGTLSGSLTTSYIPNNASGLRIAAGTTEANPSLFFNGQIAEVRIWNKARTQAEIQSDMNKRLTGKETNLVAYYPLNKVESGKALDLAGNNQGTIVNEVTNVTDQTLSLTPVLQGEQFGKVAEVRIWGLALSNEEVEVNSKTLISGNESGLLAYYPLNEATGTEIRDNSGNLNKGTLLSGNWWGCSAPIGYVKNPGIPIMGGGAIKFDGVNDYIQTTAKIPSGNEITIEYWFKGSNLQSAVRQQDTSSNWIVAGWNNSGTYLHIISTDGGTTGINVGAAATNGNWHHVAMTWKRNTPNGFVSYLDGVLVAQRNSLNVALPNINSTLYIGSLWGTGEFSNGQITEVRIWNKARTQQEIQADMNKRLTGKEANLLAYYPLNEIKLEGTVKKVLDLVAGNNGTVFEAIALQDNTLPIKTIGDNSLISSEYSSIIIDPITKGKSAIMRRFFAYPVEKGVNILPDKRIETLELKWIGNAQFAPTLLGYIEGPPPVPSENLTLADDYNGATSVELTMSEDVEFNWTRSQDSGLGGMVETLLGVGGEASFGILAEKGLEYKKGFKGNLDFSYQFQNESSITSSSSLSMTDKLELRGTPEEDPKFPHLGNRFIPKNIGYALVVSAISDVFVTRLARSKKMVGYQVQPVDGIPPDINTITFLINPAYTMNGSLDGMTGSSPTSDRFFKHVPEMRSQYGSLYPASYYRLQEAYDLKRQIEAEDKRRESYFSNFNVRMIDETSLDRNIDSGDAPTTIGVKREEDIPSTEMTAEEKQASQTQELEQFQQESEAAAEKQSAAAKAKQKEIESKIADQEARVHATESFAGWQKRMEDIQIKAGKRNIVNTYVWDADGGLRTEAQSFANTVEHTIGGSFSLNAGLGGAFEYLGGAAIEITAQVTVNMTQTMSKTESRSKGLELTIDLSGMENKGVTDYKDNPILPGEKVDRYRFMSFYLEGSTQHFQDFFNYVVDPEWLQSNDEEARALRQVQAGKPNKTWRVLHRVTYVERPSLMGFGRDVRQFKVRDENVGIGKVIVDVATLQQKVDQILEWISSQPK
ncbi:MAG: LamG-like jellyroll fold domain-containing protein [Phormidium sp.]